MEIERATDLPRLLFQAQRAPPRRAAKANAEIHSGSTDSQAFHAHKHVCREPVDLCHADHAAHSSARAPPLVCARAPSQWACPRRCAIRHPAIRSDVLARDSGHRKQSGLELFQQPRLRHLNYLLVQSKRRKPYQCQHRYRASRHFHPKYTVHDRCRCNTGSKSKRLYRKSPPSTFPCAPAPGFRAPSNRPWRLVSTFLALTDPSFQAFSHLSPPAQTTAPHHAAAPPPARRHLQIRHCWTLRRLRSRHLRRPAPRPRAKYEGRSCEPRRHRPAPSNAERLRRAPLAKKPMPMPGDLQGRTTRHFLPLLPQSCPQSRSAHMPHQTNVRKTNQARRSQVPASLPGAEQAYLKASTSTPPHLADATQARRGSTLQAKR